MGFGTWLRNRSRLLEYLYLLTHKFFTWFDPLFSRLGYEQSGRWVRPAEEAAKRLIFDCRMCGQCVLHSTGMTCPMTCPKNLRNGPCGGVRINGHCEVKPEMRCVWVEAFERASNMPKYGHQMAHLQPPVNRLLEGTSSWINMLTGEDAETPRGWKSVARDVDASATVETDKNSIPISTSKDVVIT